MTRREALGAVVAPAVTKIAYANSTEVTIQTPTDTGRRDICKVLGPEGRMDRDSVQELRGLYEWEFTSAEQLYAAFIGIFSKPEYCNADLCLIGRGKGEYVVQQWRKIA